MSTETTTHPFAPLTDALDTAGIAYRIEYAGGGGEPIGVVVPTVDNDNGHAGNLAYGYDPEDAPADEAPWIVEFYEADALDNGDQPFWSDSETLEAAVEYARNRTAPARPFPTGTPVTFKAMRGDVEVTVSGIVTDDHLTRSSRFMRTVAPDGAADGTTTAVSIANLTAVRPPLVEPMDAKPEPEPDDELMILRAAVARMAEVLGDAMTAGDTGGHFSCGEAEALADVLRAAGHTDAADEWIEGHAGADDEGDDHYREDPAVVALRAAGKCVAMLGWHRDTPCGADAAEDSCYCTTHEHLSADD